MKDRIPSPKIYMARTSEDKSPDTLWYMLDTIGNGPDNVGNQSQQHNRRPSIPSRKYNVKERGGRRVPPKPGPKDQYSTGCGPGRAVLRGGCIPPPPNPVKFFVGEPRKNSDSSKYRHF